MNPYRLIARLSVIGAFLCCSIHAETPVENALATRYITLLTYGLKNAKGEQLAQYKQEPLILGAIAYYYYRERDLELPRKLEILLWG